MGNSKWAVHHREEVNVTRRAWAAANPDKILAYSQEQCRKGGKFYEKKLEYQHTGLQGERYGIRKKHGRQYRPFKQIIAPNSVLHHEWIPGTARYRGVALVEKDQHMHGFIDVIQILEGKITLLMEGLENE